MKLTITPEVAAKLGFSNVNCFLMIEGKKNPRSRLRPALSELSLLFHETALRNR